MNERVCARGVFGGVSNNGLSGTERAENARAASAAKAPRGGPPGAGPPRGANPAMSPRGGSGFPFLTRDDDGPGVAVRSVPGAQRAGGFPAFGPGAAAQQAGAEQGGGSRGGSARGGTALLGVKRSVGDVLGARAFFDGGHHAAGFADQPGSKRGMSWHGGTAVASALREDAFPSRLEKTSHGANLAFGAHGPWGIARRRAFARRGRGRHEQAGRWRCDCGSRSMQSGSGGSGGAGESFLVDRPPDALDAARSRTGTTSRMTLTGEDRSRTWWTGWSRPWTPTRARCGCSTRTRRASGARSTRTRTCRNAAATPLALGGASYPRELHQVRSDRTPLPDTNKCKSTTYDHTKPVSSLGRTTRNREKTPYPACKTAARLLG